MIKDQIDHFVRFFQTIYINNQGVFNVLGASYFIWGIKYNIYNIIKKSHVSCGPCHCWWGLWIWFWRWDLLEHLCHKKDTSVSFLLWFIDISLKHAIISKLLWTILYTRSLKLSSSLPLPQTIFLFALHSAVYCGGTLLHGLARGDLGVLQSRNSTTKLLSTLSNSVLMSWSWSGTF